MPSKNKDQKPDHSQSRIVASKKSSGGYYVFRRYLPNKELFRTISKISIEEEYKNDFHYSSRASWTSKLLAPVHNRRTEQLFIDTGKALCSSPVFQDDVIAIKAQLERFGDAFLEGAANQLCKDWKIVNGTQWVIWLLKHWDPTKITYPPITPSPPAESFSPWIIELLYQQKKAGSIQKMCRSATITLYAGVSGREAVRVAKLAQQALDSSKARQGRPRLSEIERAALRAEFEAIGIPNRKLRSSMIDKVQRSLVQKGYRKLSVTTIGNELRRWLLERGIPVRRYWTEPPNRID
jgi:hypothetical protein